MLRNNVIAGLVLAFSLAALAGCASAARAAREPLADSVSAALVSEKELKNSFGYGNENPFIAPKGSFLPKVYDYVALRLTIVSNEKASVEILQAEVADKAGNKKANLYDRKTFSDYACDPGMSQSEQFAERRRRAIEWNYLPGSDFEIERGKHEYILVFMGKHPLPGELEAYVRLAVSGREQEFSLPIPNAGE